MNHRTLGPASLQFTTGRLRRRSVPATAPVCRAQAPALPRSIGPAAADTRKAYSVEVGVAWQVKTAGHERGPTCLPTHDRVRRPVRRLPPTDAGQTPLAHASSAWLLQQRRHSLLHVEIRMAPPGGDAGQQRLTIRKPIEEIAPSVAAPRRGDASWGKIADHCKDAKTRFASPRYRQTGRRTGLRLLRDAAQRRATSAAICGGSDVCGYRGRVFPTGRQGVSSWFPWRTSRELCRVDAVAACTGTCERADLGAVDNPVFRSMAQADGLNPKGISVIRNLRRNAVAVWGAHRQLGRLSDEFRSTSAHAGCSAFLRGSIDRGTSTEPWAEPNNARSVGQGHPRRRAPSNDGQVKWGAVR